MVFELEKIVRENIKRLVPYSSARREHTGNARVFLDANENSFGSPLAESYNRYPDPVQTELRERVAALSGICPSEVFVGNGSDEAIDLLVRIFCRPGVDDILVCPPTYGMYEVAAGINDVGVKRVNLTSDFELDQAAVFAGLSENTKLLFLCSPNNPTGNVMCREAVLEIAEKFSGIVVVDEAYIHFSSQTSLTAEIKRLSNLVILQTFSKAYGLAGLRVGLAFANAEIITLLDKVKSPYNVSQASQQFVLDALDKKSEVDHTVAQIIRERDALADALRRLSVVTQIYPSEANFLLTKFTDPITVYNYLLGEQIVVRNRSNLQLCDGCLRITVGTPDENDALLRALKKYESGTYEKSTVH